MAASKKIYDAIYTLVSALADNYGFDADEAMEHVETGTDVNFVEAIQSLKTPAPRKKKEEEPKPEPKPEPKKAEPEPEPKKEEKEKRIKRMTPTIGNQLKTALSNVGIEMDDKLKKEFVKFVEALDDETWRANGLSDHMRHFAESKAPKKEEPVVETSEPKVVTIEDLKKVDLLTEVDTPGVFWNGDDGVFVTGPAEEDEDMTEIKFNSKDYVVGEKTGRVYEVSDSKDVFVGFAGIGKFKTMEV